MREHNGILYTTASDELDFVWKWIDRMARGELPVQDCLNVLTHYPGAPEWVKKVTSQNAQPNEDDETAPGSITDLG